MHTNFVMSNRTPYTNCIFKLVTKFSYYSGGHLERFSVIHHLVENLTFAVLKNLGYRRSLKKDRTLRFLHFIRRRKILLYHEVLILYLPQLL